jgi:hypothetical protein
MSHNGQDIDGIGGLINSVYQPVFLVDATRIAIRHASERLRMPGAGIWRAF